MRSLIERHSYSKTKIKHSLRGGTLLQLGEARLRRKKKHVVTLDTVELGGIDK